MSMDDTLLPSSDSVSTASTEPAASSPAPDTSPQDTRAIAAGVFADSGDVSADPPPAPVPADSPTPAAAISDEFDENDPVYQKLLASGSMPVDRHRAVITNTRKKTRAEVEQEYQAKYGWAEQFDRQRAEHGLGILNGLDRAPEQTLRNLAQLLGVSLTPPVATEPEGPPPPDVKLEDGSEFYSAKQLAKLHEWKDKQYEQKLNALEQRYRPLVEERHLAKLDAESKSYAGTTLAECRAQWPQFTALENDIKARMEASDKLAKQHGDPTLSLSLERAYIQAFAQKGLPAIQQQHATDRASQLTRKAAASAPPPGAPRPVVPLRYNERSTRDIAAEVFANL